MSGSTRTISKASKDALRKLVPDSLLKQRDIVQRLGPAAGRIYATMRFFDGIGVRGSNRRLVPTSARSFVFVCFGNIMRSALAEFLMRRELEEAKMNRVQIISAGLHAVAGREAHPWAQQASAEMGISLTEHRAKPLTREMVEQADCIMAMDFQNKAELLVLYPESRLKIYMLSAYAEGPWQFREIPDPYTGDLAITRLCAQQLQICIRNLVISMSSPGRES
jgi:protein-tyrosine phosphatase